MASDQVDLADAEEDFGIGDEFDLTSAEEYFDAVEPKVVAQSKGKAPVTSLADFRSHASKSNDGDAAVKKPRVKPSAISLADFDEEEAYKGSAMDQCLALPEMLERILQHVPPLQLYPLQRVNTLFRDLIWRSISIRRHMFMLPHDKYFVRGELNRLFAPKSRSKLRLATAPFHLELYADRTGRGVDVTIHKAWTNGRRRKVLPYNRLRQEFPNDQKASWREMLISYSDTPLHLKLTIPDCPVISESKVTGEVTLGVVVDEAKRLADNLWPERERHLEQPESMESMFACMDDQLYGDHWNEEGLRAYF